MRWLVRRVLRREVLELEDGTVVYYPNRVAGPGHLLQAGERRRLEGYNLRVTWVFVIVIAVFFSPVKNSLEAWLFWFTDDTYYAMLLGLGLIGCAMPFFLWLAQFGKRRFVEGLSQRDPAFWDEDLKRLSAASKAEGGSGFLLIFVAVFVVGWSLGAMLELALKLLNGA